MVFFDYEPEYPHLNNKMISYDKLIAGIEQLEKNNIISFDEFEKLPFLEIRKRYFSIPNPTMIEKAKILIRDKRDGKKGPSEFITITDTYKEGEIVKRVIKRDLF